MWQNMAKVAFLRWRNMARVKEMAKINSLLPFCHESQAGWPPDRAVTRAGGGMWLK
jgi:hypothetical protein